MKRMLINATQPEEIRVALVDGQKIYDLDIENTSREQKKANIYIGTVKNLEPSLNAAFIDYGSERHGFLPVKEIAREYWQEQAAADDQDDDDDSDGSGGRSFKRRPNIKDILKVGQQVLVQVDKEERGSKGAALTTFITLAGCYLVLMPNNPRAGGISRRIDGDERDELKDALSTLEVPQGMGLIVRTAGVGRSASELEWDMSVLLKRWEDIQNAIETLSPPALIHQERDLIARAVRDHLRDDIGEIIIDDDHYYNKAKQYIERLRPDALNRVKLYTDKIPLFSRFQIESQIESAFKREVTLPSGGAVVIDHTEALISIDINSARATKGSDIEETALQTNLEAADEIARQLRLRDIGGLIVIDFIDMTPTSHQREVENRLREALRLDRARVQVGRISRFGLLEMSRQRLRSSLEESIQEPCPRCDGQGNIRGIESLSLSIIRLIEEEAMKDRTYEVHAALPVEVATFLANEKRDMLIALEKRHNVRVLIIPVLEIQAPAYQLRRIRHDEETSFSGTSSYQMAKELATQMVEESTEAQASKAVEKPAVDYMSASTNIKRVEPSIFTKMFQALSRTLKAMFDSKPKQTSRNKPRGDGRQQNRQGRHRNQNRRRSGGGSDDRRRGGGRQRNRRRGGGRDDRYENRDNREGRESRDNREGRESRDNRDNREARDNRDRNRGRGNRNNRSRDNREERKPREYREPRFEENKVEAAKPVEAPKPVEAAKPVEASKLAPPPAPVAPKVEPVAENKPAPAPKPAQSFSSPLMEESKLVNVTAQNVSANNNDVDAKQQNPQQQRRRANHLRPYAGNKQEKSSEAPSNNETQEQK